MAPLTNNVHNTALVFEGGGYRAAYTAAFANALLAEGIYFDFVCGISAGSSHAVDYLSRDKRRVRNAFMGFEGSAKPAAGVGSILHGTRYFNADYLYEGCVEDGSLPFDWDTFQANPARVAVSAFERDTGRTRVFTREDMPTWQDLMACVRASSSLPVLMKPQPIDGVTYLDGGLGEGAGIPLFMAERAGYTRFLLVATRPAGYRKEPPSKGEKDATLRFGSEHPHVREALLSRSERYNAELDRIAQMEREGRCLVIRPDMMPVKSTTLDPVALRTAYALGEAQARRDMPRYKEFLFGDPNWMAPQDER